MEQVTENKNIKNILFVDNDHGFANEINDLVKRMEVESKHGYHVDHAPDIVAAMKKLEKNSYELVILELVLPVLSGYLLIEKIKKNYPNTRIIVYTRLKAPQDLAKTAASGVDNIYLKELISIEELVQQIIQGEKPGDIEETLKRLNEKSKELMSQEVQENNLLTQCSKCHLMIPPDSYFCNNCGQKMTKKDEEILIQKPAGKKGAEGKAVEIKNQTPDKKKEKEVSDEGKVASGPEKEGVKDVDNAQKDTETEEKGNDGVDKEVSTDDSGEKKEEAAKVAEEPKIEATEVTEEKSEKNGVSPEKESESDIEAEVEKEVKPLEHSNDSDTPEEKIENKDKLNNV